MPKLTKRQEKRLAQIWQILWLSNWTDKEHLRILKRLVRRKYVR